MAFNWSIFLPNLIAFAILSILTILYLKKYIAKEIPFNEVILNFFFGILYSLVSIIYSLDIFSSSSLRWIRLIYLSLGSVQIIFFFYFLESLIKLKYHQLSLILLITFTFIQQMGIWLEVIFFDLTISFIFFGQICQFLYVCGNNLLGIYVYGIFGIQIFYKNYKYSQKKKSLLLYVLMVIITTGFTITFITNIIEIFIVHSGIEFVNILTLFGDLLPFIGLLGIAMIYSLDVHYIYQFSFDNYFIYVFHNSGKFLAILNLETKDKTLNINENYFISLFSAINMVYSTTFDSRYQIDSINTNDTSILIENGKYVNAIVASEKITRVFSRGLKLFLTEFEKKYKELIDVKNIIDSSYGETFTYANSLLKKIFPSLNIRKDKFF